MQRQPQAPYFAKLSRQCTVRLPLRRTSWSNWHENIYTSTYAVVTTSILVLVVSILQEDAERERERLMMAVLVLRSCLIPTSFLKWFLYNILLYGRKCVIFIKAWLWDNSMEGCHIHEPKCAKFLLMLVKPSCSKLPKLQKWCVQCSRPGSSVRRFAVSWKVKFYLLSQLYIYLSKSMA